MQSPAMTTQNPNKTLKPISLPTSKLIVVVPPDQMDEQALLSRVRILAETLHLPILWFALAVDADQDYQMRYRLRNLKMMVSSIQIRSEYHLAYCHDWLDAILSVYTPGDRIICLDRHIVRSFGFFQQPIAQYLSSKHNFAVEIIRDVDLYKPVPTSKFIRESAVWILSLVIIIAFFLGQVYIDQNLAGIPAKILLVLFVLVEFVLVAQLGNWG